MFNVSLGFFWVKKKLLDRKAAVALLDSTDGGDPYLSTLGERVRRMRSIRGMTRKDLARAAGVSERHLANLELGVGNVSILVLRQIAHAFNCAMAELVVDISPSSPEWLLIRELLEKRSEEERWEESRGGKGCVSRCGSRGSPN